MKLLVIGAGMMGSAAAYDMACQGQVDLVTLADSDVKRARDVATRVNRITGEKKVLAAGIDASKGKDVARLMKGHDGALSAVPYFLNLGLAQAAISAGCHFADLGGNNTVVRQELALAKKAEKAMSVLLLIAASLQGWLRFWAANWCIASTGAPMRSTVCRRPARETHATLSLSTCLLGRGPNQRVRGTGAHSAER